MRTLATAVVAAVLATSAATTPAAGAAPNSPLLAYLNRISGQSTISGQHNREPNADPTRYTREAQRITGLHPWTLGRGLPVLPNDVSNRQIMINEAIRQWRAGRRCGGSSTR